jgi:hypothetical protein
MTDEEKAKYAKQVGVKLTTGSGTKSQERNLSAADRKAIVNAKRGQGKAGQGKTGNNKPLVGRLNKKK